MAVRSLSATELHALVREGAEPLTLLDVREDWEVDLARIDGALCVPMSRVADALDTLDRGRTTVVICHHGIRSLHVANFLARSGFSRLANLAGGIDAWACEVDPTMARY